MANPLKRIDIDQAFFQEAVLFTAAKTGFDPALVEKDYFCSLVLSYLYSSLSDSLIFKGGTALNKVHVGFYRLSEDLDFSIAMSLESTRSQRSKAMEPAKKIFAELPARLSGLKMASPISGRNNSLQYIGEVGYPSIFQETGVIQIEVGLREPTLLDTKVLDAATLLLSPADEKSLIEAIPVRVYDARETIAEKLRALFCRREPAIRDLFDVSHMIEKSILNPEDEEILELARRKMAVPGNDFIGMTPERVVLLKEQVDNELWPVLQEKVHREFNIEESLHQTAKIEERIRKPG